MPRPVGALDAYFIALSVLLGLVLGSFINCACYRLVHGGSVVRGRSACPACGHILAARDLVPLFSWLFLKGRCRYCGGRVSVRYPLSEAASALVVVSAYLRWGVSAAALEYAVFGLLLVASALTDFDCGLIYDRFIAAMIADFVFFTLLGAWPAPWAALASGLVGGLAVALPLFVTVLVMDRVMGRDTMGGGDIKLVFACGLFLGWKAALLSLILACLIGLLFAVAYKKWYNDPNEGGTFPFGPSIGLASYLVLLFGQPLIAWYIGLF